MRICLILLLGCMTTFVHLTHAQDNLRQSNADVHTSITMRLIGHHVMLASGDSTSIVKPVEQINNLYKIRFANEFGFDPANIAKPIDSIIAATDISKNYAVQIVSCDSLKVVHGYEIGEAVDLIGCIGREQPSACYEIWITLLDQASIMNQLELAEESNSTGDSEPIINTLDQQLLNHSVSTLDQHAEEPPLAASQERCDEVLANLSAEDKSESQISVNTLLIVALSILSLIILLLLRRRSSRNKVPHEIRIGEYVFDSRKMELTFKDQRVELTGKEADLLKLLSDAANNTVERDDILKSVWGDDGDYVGRTLDVFISKLRKKLEADSDVRIVNIRGIGYKLIVND